MADSFTIFNRVNIAITDDIKNELRLQGHYLTGTLEASITERITKEGGIIVLSAQAAEYLQSLERYTPADEIKIDNKEFEELKRWVILRGMASYGHEATAVAARIVDTWKKEGRPTEGSKAYSETGKRTEAVATAFDNNEVKYTGMIDKTIYDSLDEEFLSIKPGTI